MKHGATSKTRLYFPILRKPRRHGARRTPRSIIATQSAVDVTGTAGAEALLESMPTKLFLANPELPEKAADTFRLNPAEMNTIRGLIPKRELYLRRTDAAGVLRLEVDPASYWLYTSSPVDARETGRSSPQVRPHRSY